MEKARDIVIIGAGPAGLSAAIYAARANRKPVLLTGPEPGGQAGITFAIENYPGFPEGIGGPELVARLQQQAEKFGAEIVMESVTGIDVNRRPFSIHTNAHTFHAKALIIAIGASPRKLLIPGEKEFTGRGVSYCATCDGWFFRQKEVAVIGGGDSALEEAIFLTRFASKVTILHRREELRAGAFLRNQAEKNDKIHFRMLCIAESILGDEKVTGLRVRNVRDDTIAEIPLDGVFIFIGHLPNTDMLRGLLDMDEHGYLRTDALMRTSADGIFAAGEAADPVFRQVATSAGMGVAAAISAERWLTAQE